MDKPRAADEAKTILVEFRGKLLAGRYRVDGVIVTVTSQDGRSKAMHAWPTAAEAVARVLLMELEEEVRGRRPLT
jgi:hypothetical protein